MKTIFGGGGGGGESLYAYIPGAYIRNFNWLTYLGGVLTRFYSLLVNLGKVRDENSLKHVRL